MSNGTGPLQFEASGECPLGIWACPGGINTMLWTSQTGILIWVTWQEEGPAVRRLCSRLA
jgi:hypothetical protein